MTVFRDMQGSKNSQFTKFFHINFIFARPYYIFASNIIKNTF